MGPLLLPLLDLLDNLVYLVVEILTLKNSSLWLLQKKQDRLVCSLGL